MLSMLRCKIKEGEKFRFMKAKTSLKFYDQRTINDQLRIILQEQFWDTLTFEAGSPREKKSQRPKQQMHGLLEIRWHSWKSITDFESSISISISTLKSRQYLFCNVTHIQ